LVLSLQIRDAGEVIVELDVGGEPEICGVVQRLAERKAYDGVRLKVSAATADMQLAPGSPKIAEARRVRQSRFAAAGDVGWSTNGHGNRGVGEMFFLRAPEPGYAAAYQQLGRCTAGAEIIAGLPITTAKIETVIEAVRVVGGGSAARW
jgi:hypothetical protein